MSAAIFIIAIIVVAGFAIFIAGRAIRPATVQRKFDETPADVVPTDVSDGTSIDWTPIASHGISNEEIAIMERFGESLRADRRP